MSIKAVPEAGAQGAKFSLSSVVFVLVYVFLMFSFIVTAVVLVVVAQHQNTIYSTAGKIGPVIAGFLNNGQSLSATVSNCLRPFKVFWNVLWTFVFAVIQRIANADNVNIFHQYNSRQYARFNVINVLCDVLLPVFEVVVNFLIIVLNFVLQIVLVFLQFVVSLGLGNFSAFEVILQVLFTAFLDTIDPRGCIHPVTGPLGFPGNILKCMGCGIPVPVMNENTTTKTNAVFVCACGGDIHGDTLTNVEGCIHLQDVINALETFAGYFVTAFEWVKNLVTGAASISSIWTEIQNTYNKVVDGLSPVRKAVCSIPFICKILKIRSLPNGADDNYVCSYSIDSPNDPPVCFYESEFDMHHVLNITYDSTIADLHHQLAAIQLPGTFGRRPAAPRATMAGFARDTPRARGWTEHRGVESPVREFMIAAAVLLTHLPQSIHQGRAVSMEALQREFHARDFRPHEVRRGLQRMVRGMGLTPLNFDDVEAFRRQRSVTGDERAVSPPPTEILFSIGTYLVTFAMNGVTNLSQMVRSMASVLLPVAATLVPTVIQLAFGAIQNIVPAPFVSLLPTFDLFGPISGIFTPLYNLDASQAIPVQMFTDAFNAFSTLFNNVLSSKIGVVVLQYIFTLGILIGIDGNNRPPVHPDIGSINQLLTVILNCNPQQTCHTPNDCGLSQCNCGNGTVVATTGYCQQTGRCYCFPMLLDDAPQPLTTIDLSIDLVGEDYGYVTKNPVWPFATPWQSVLNCLSTFWNGAAPHIVTTLAWGLYVPWFTVILHYTIGWCPCCKPITGFLLKLSTVGTTASIALQVLARPTTDYCAMRSAFYCRLWRHFVRPEPPTWGQHILFGMNYGTSSFGLIISVVVAIVVVLFVIMMTLALGGLVAEALSLAYRWYVYSYNSETPDPAEQIHTLDTDDTEVEDFGLDAGADGLAFELDTPSS